MATRRKWQRHIDDLVAELDIPRRPVPRYTRFGPRFRMPDASVQIINSRVTDITIPARIETREDYIASLHEIGHAKAGHAERNIFGDERLECEAEAWLWALENRADTDPLDIDIARECFASYTRDPYWAGDAYEGYALRAFQALDQEA